MLGLDVWSSVIVQMHRSRWIPAESSSGVADSAGILKHQIAYSCGQKRVCTKNNYQKLIHIYSVNIFYQQEKIVRWTSDGMTACQFIPTSRGIIDSLDNIKKSCVYTRINRSNRRFIYAKKDIAVRHQLTAARANPQIELSTEQQQIPARSR
jgi:hypothetical protein